MFDIRTILGENTPLISIVAVGCSWAGGKEKFYSLLNQGLASLVGFEPNPVEFGKLQEIAAEHNKSLGRECYKYFPYAIGDGKLRTFHNLNDFLNSSILPPNYAIHHYLETVPGEFDIKSVEIVQTIRLDEIKDIGDVDYLYLDTQGFELTILENAQNLLKNSVVIHTEVCFVDLYQNQPLFSDIDIYLRRNGFCYHHSEQFGARTCLPFTFQELGSCSQQAWADFVYITAYDRLYRLPSKKLLALAVIAHGAYRAWDLAGHALLVHDRVYGSDYAVKYKDSILKTVKPQVSPINLPSEDEKRGQIAKFISDVISNNQTDKLSEAADKLNEFANLIDISNPSHHYAWVNILGINLLNLTSISSNVNDETTYDKLISLFYQVRERSAKFILNLNDEEVMQLFPSLLKQTVESLSFISDCQRPPLPEADGIAVSRMVARCNYLLENSQQSGLMQLLLALRMYKLPHELEIPFHKFNITGYFWDYYVCNYLNYYTLFAGYLGENDRYYSLIEARLKLLLEGIEKEKPSYLTVLSGFTSRFYYHNLYLSSTSCYKTGAYRGSLLRKLLQLNGSNLDYHFAPISEDRNIIRIGLIMYSVHYADFAATGVYVENLDHNDFQVYVYGVFVSAEDEDYMRAQGFTFREIPQDLAKAAEIIRSDDLDILIIGSNITFNSLYLVTQLACYRLARIQVATALCPVTTGLPTIDYFISGTSSEESSGQEAYTEKLLTVQGSGLCFRSDTRELPTYHYSRADFGIPIDAIVYASGANTLKSTPEAWQVWLSILKECPNSYFITYPHNSGWWSDPTLFLQIGYRRHFLKLAEQEGIDKHRIVFLHEKFPDRAAIIAFLRDIVDVYLDSFPYTGAFSLLDPLDAGVPIITLKGRYLRQAQGGALLQEIGLYDLVTTSVSDYISMAVTIGSNRSFREEFRQKTEKAMTNPPFRDTHLFANKLAPVYIKLVEEWKQKWAQQLS